MPSKPCEHCGRVFEKTATMTRWAERQFCDRACRGAAKRVRPATSTCLTCGTEFRSKSGRDVRNRYCSVACIARRPRALLAPDATGRSRALALYPDGQPCEVCGTPFKPGRYGVVRHHRDSDRLNNSPENIAWLCRVHHSAAHAASDRKVGGGARPRVNRLQREAAVDRARRAKALIAAGSSQDAAAAALGVHRVSMLRWFRKYAADL